VSLFSRAAILASVSLALGIGIGVLVTSTVVDDDEPDRPMAREELVDAFDDEGIVLEQQYGAVTGLVDASYTIAGEELGDETPLVVELLRTIPAAQVREEFLIEHAPETEMVLTVLRSRNAVAVHNGVDADLFARVQGVMDELEN
jgi:hypothetical protein